MEPAFFNTRAHHEEWEAKSLAPYAALSGRSKGRVHPEKEHELRTCYQRDRDRIIHSVAFRRLEYKTQVFINWAGDHYRTRLTHTLEVAQIARTLGRILGLNEDLCEANALAHDLGHPPFGHAGERILNTALSDGGGFEHNAQALRIVDWLERHYPNFPGLNLTAETRRGILKNKSPYTGMGVKLPDTLSIEAQIVDIADEISYNTHDLDDGIESGLVELDDVIRLPLWSEACEKVKARYPSIDAKRERHQIIVQLIDTLVTDVVDQTVKNLERAGHSSLDRIVNYSETIQKKTLETKAFLTERLYRHPKVLRTTSRCNRIVERLFEHYCANPEQLPSSFRERIESGGLRRPVADYIAGMTDRFAEEDCRQLFGFL